MNALFSSSLGGLRVAHVLGCLVVCWALVPFAALAQTSALEQPMRFTVHDPCGGGSASICGATMVGMGVITAETAALFAQKYQELDRPTMLLLVSPGGNLAGGMELGRAIRARRMHTILDDSFTDFVVPPGPVYLEKVERVVFSQGGCFSACAYAFLGGVEREVRHDRLFGVHQFRWANPGSGAEAVESTQLAAGAIALYLRDMGVDRSLLDIALHTSAQSMTRLTVAQARALGVDNMALPPGRWELRATTSGQPQLFLKHPLSPGRTAYVGIHFDPGRVVFVVAVSLNRTLIAPARIARHEVGETPSVSITIDGAPFDGVPMTPWVSADVDGETRIYAVVGFPVLVKQFLTRARTLEINDGMGRPATVDISIAGDFPVDGLSAGALALDRSR